MIQILIYLERNPGHLADAEPDLLRIYRVYL